MKRLILILILLISYKTMAGQADPSQVSARDSMVSNQFWNFLTAPTDPLVGQQPAPSATVTARPKPAPTMEQRWEDLKSQVKNKISGWWSADKQKAAPTAKSGQPTALPAAPTVEKVALDPFPKVEKPSQALPSFKGQSLTDVKSPGRTGQQDLKKNSKGVPTVRNINVKKIPAVDIGEEPQISKRDFAVPQPKLLTADYFNTKQLKSPTSMADSSYLSRRGNLAQEKVAPPQQIARDPALANTPMTLEMIQKIQPKVAMTDDTPEKMMTQFKAEDLKLLAALLIDYKKDKCHVVAGLYKGLLSVPGKKEVAELRYSVCLHKMGFYSESVERLVTIIKTANPAFLNEALTTVLGDLPLEYEEVLADALHQLKAQVSVKDEIRHKMRLVLAKRHYRLDQHKAAYELAQLIPETSKLYAQARFLMGITLYAQKDVKGAIAQLEKLVPLAEAKKIPKEIRSLIFINLGRFYFQVNDFEKSVKAYVKIDKDTPLWIEGLTEQGWAQILNEDYVGAIGNMYSIHSPYFKSVFKPETYVVRTIGYLNICQYGDAYRTLSQLEEVYRPWKDRMLQFEKGKTQALGYYETVRAYLKSPSSTDVDGLPYQIIREMARHRDFLNVQETMNHKVDEGDQYAFIQKLIEGDRNKLAAASPTKKVDKKTKKPLPVDPLELEVFNFKMALFEEGKKNFTSIRQEGDMKIARLKGELREKAGRILKGRFGEMKEMVSRVLDNNELLRYEVFAGSGENLRYQVAGGEVGPNRIPASVRPTGKNLQWAFDGEYWEDEIGHYRSTLVNNCPDAKKKKVSNQASLQ